MKTARRAIVAVALAAASLGALPATAQAGTCDHIPLPSGHWYGINDGTPYSHSGLTSTDAYNVRKIQRIVNNATDPDIAVDGRYGYATRDGVIRFQRVLRSYGGDNAVDGKYGARTWYQAWNYGWGGFQC